MLFSNILICFRKRHRRKFLLIRLVEVDANPIHCRQDDQHIGADRLCKQGTGTILINDSCNPFQTIRRFHNRNAAATYGDDDIAGLDQLLHDLQFYNPLRNRRRYHAAIATSRIFYKGEALFCSDPVRFFLRIKTSYRLGRIGKPGVFLVYHHLRDHRSAFLIDMTCF